MSKVANHRWRLAQFLEFYWWRGYLRKRPSGEYLERKRAYWEVLLRETGIAYAPGQTALDVGCGPSGAYMVLSGLVVDAVDPLLERYARGLDIFRPEKYPWTDFHAVAFEDWVPGRTYDRVFCMNAVNHFRDMGAAIAKLRAVLAPGGFLLLSVDVHNSPYLKRIFQTLPGDLLHPHQYSIDDYREILVSAGLEILQERVLKKGKIFDYIVFLATIPARG
ncbi:MAG: class I SAM-dependent methyltransferase [Saprospiraceae bacterium]|jgi:2-polyprenyl-6-hydroxyphenyl methylase/3-demethylubiquinone-9 3-methyltransferase